MTAELRDGWRTWRWVTLVVGATAAGLSLTLHLGAWAEAIPDGRRREAVLGVVQMSVLITAIVAVLALLSMARLWVGCERRRLATWLLAGIPPAAASRLVLAELMVVGAAGGSGGALLSVALLPVFHVEIAANLGVPADGPAGASWSAILGSAVASVVLTLLGGMAPARGAVSASPLRALSDGEPEGSTAPRGRRRALAGLVAAAAVWSVVGIAGAPTLDEVFMPSMSLLAVLCCGLALFADVLLPAAVRAWSWGIPDRWALSWYLARRSAAARLTRTATLATPLILGSLLAGGMYSVMSVMVASWRASGGTFEGGASSPVENLALVLPALAICAATSVGALLATGEGQEHDEALLEAAGVAPSTCRLTGALTVVAVVVTATLVGVGALVALSAVMTAAIATSSAATARFAVDLAPTVGFCLVVGAALLIVAVHHGRRNGRVPLAVRLRGRSGRSGRRVRPRR